MRRGICGSPRLPRRSRRLPEPTARCESRPGGRGATGGQPRHPTPHAAAMPRCRRVGLAGEASHVARKAGCSPFQWGASATGRSSAETVDPGGVGWVSPRPGPACGMTAVRELQLGERDRLTGEPCPEPVAPPRLAITTRQPLPLSRRPGATRPLGEAGPRGARCPRIRAGRMGLAGRRVAGPLLRSGRRLPHGP